MPEIARFYGIIIKMFFKPKEHDHPIFMPYMANMSGFLISKHIK